MRNKHARIVFNLRCMLSRGKGILHMEISRIDGGLGRAKLIFSLSCGFSWNTSSCLLEKTRELEKGEDPAFNVLRVKICTRSSTSCLYTRRRAHACGHMSGFLDVKIAQIRSHWFKDLENRTHGIYMNQVKQQASNQASNHMALFVNSGPKILLEATLVSSSQTRAG